MLEFFLIFTILLIFVFVLISALDTTTEIKYVLIQDEESKSIYFNMFIINILEKLINKRGRTSDVGRHSVSSLPLT